MLLELEMPEGQKPAMPADLLSSARDAWMEQARNVSVSKLQRDVERELRLIGQQPSVEYLTDDGFFSIDLAFPGAASCFLPKAQKGARTFCRRGRFRSVTLLKPHNANVGYKHS